MLACDEIVYEQKADQFVVVSTCIAGGVTGLFFVYQGVVGSINLDFIYGGLLQLTAGGILFLYGTIKRYLRLKDSKIVYERKTFFGETSIEIEYGDILSVGLTEYLGSLKVNSKDGTQIEIAHTLNQISGSIVVSQGHKLENSNLTVEKMEALLEEIRRRIKKCVGEYSGEDSESK
ncbi:hypothetical protein D3C87_1384350 [compost metagenome]